MSALMLLLLAMLQGPATPRTVRFEGRIVREGFIKGQIPPPLTIRLTEILQLEQTRSPKVFTAAINAEGFFEVSELPAGLYSLYLFPDMLPEAMSIPWIDAREDVVDWWLTVPLTAMTVPVQARVTLEGAGPLPPFQLSLKRTNLTQPGVERTSGSGSNPLVISEVPVGEYSVVLSGLPEGYRVKSILDGATDLLAQKLTIHPAMPPLIEITIARNR